MSFRRSAHSILWKNYHFWQFFIYFWKYFISFVLSLQNGNCLSYASSESSYIEIWYNFVMGSVYVLSFWGKNMDFWYFFTYFWKFFNNFCSFYSKENIFMSCYICKKSHCNIIEFCHSEDLHTQFWGETLIFDSFSRISGNIL